MLCHKLHHLPRSKYSGFYKICINKGKAGLKSHYSKGRALKAMALFFRSVGGMIRAYNIYSTILYPFYESFSVLGTS